MKESKDNVKHQLVSILFKMNHADVSLTFQNILFVDDDLRILAFKYDCRIRGYSIHEAVCRKVSPLTSQLNSPVEVNFCKTYSGVICASMLKEILI